MKILSGVGRDHLFYRVEPISEREDAFFEEAVRRGIPEEGWIWAVFLIIRKGEAGSLVNLMEYEVERIIGEVPVSGTFTRARYTFIMVSVDGRAFESTESNRRQMRLWMAAMRVARDLGIHGATLFSPRKLIAYDATAFSHLLRASWHIDSAEYLRLHKSAKPASGRN